ncbi:PEP-CTERM sorting domain-containing protein [Chroococcidiopsis sp. CCMEE 29]|uniref:PEP-CTERM sorting domain-containing protein n=1 Tax=Chroococcidiopsis sp. CCMEE 29 TaxID=155894 RepID=UPI00202140E3|nr:PEP-CTERM sorting domain-containing protein [Chroococcidiopsis sp. CCMEE 29]
MTISYQKFVIATTGVVLSLATIGDNSVQAAVLSEIPLSAVTARFNFSIGGPFPGVKGCPPEEYLCTSAGFDAIVSDAPQLDPNLRLTNFSVKALYDNYIGGSVPPNAPPGFPETYPVSILNAFAAPGWQVAEINPSSLSFQSLTPENGIAPGDFLRGFEVALETSRPSIQRAVFLEVTSVSSTPVPEPSTILGLGMALGFGALFKREYLRNQQKAK